MFQVSKIFILFTLIQYICGFHESLLPDRKQFDDIYILSQMIENCIAKVRCENRQLVALKPMALSDEQTRKQSDLIQALLSSSKPMETCYMRLDLVLYPKNLSRHRGFNIILTDNSKLFR